MFSFTGNSARMLRLLCVPVMAIQLVAMVPGLKGEVFAVGGAAGWTVPHTGMVNYTDWAAMLTSLNIGDTLLFTYPAGEHNVVQVGEEDFTKCISTSPIATFSDGQTLVNLPTEGRYWFICGFSGHCDLGQKFAINVITLPAAGVPAPSPFSGASSPPGPGPADADAFAPSDGLSPAPSALAPASPAPESTARHVHFALVISNSLFSLLYALLAV